jgi:uncharacterized delta-60 repeat protein
VRSLLSAIMIVGAGYLAAGASVASAEPPQWASAPGRVTTTFETGRRVAEEMGGLAALPDGRVVAGGRVGRGALGLVRYLADGRLDATFGVGGAVRVGGLDQAITVVAQPDGHVTALATLPEASGKLPALALLRLEAGGAPDRAFGEGDGRVDLPLRQSCGGCVSAATTPDGGMVVAGARQTGTKTRFAVARVDARGEVDAMFGTGPLAVLFDRESQADSIAVQSDGSILVVGSRGTGPILVRLTADGRLDRSFGNRGVVELPVHLGTMLIDEAGRILVAGSPRERGSRFSRVARYTGSGTLDQGFGDNGVADLRRALERPQLFALPGEETLVVDADARKATTARLTADGRLDPTFGRHGRIVTRLGFGGGWFAADGLSDLGDHAFSSLGSVVRPDGSIVIGGSAGITRDNGGEAAETIGSELALAALDPQGHVDRRFGAAERLSLRARVLRDRLAAVRRRGLRVRLMPRRRGLARVIATAGKRRIAAGMVPLFSVRPTTATIALTRHGRRLLRRAHHVRLALRVEANDLAGNRVRVRATARLHEAP